MTDRIWNAATRAISSFSGKGCNCLARRRIAAKQHPIRVDTTGPTLFQLA
jgi:hypothetical protein